MSQAATRTPGGRKQSVEEPLIFSPPGRNRGEPTPAPEDEEESGVDNVRNRTSSLPEEDHTPITMPPVAENDKGEKRGCCRRYLPCWICLLCTLIALGILAIFLYPRIPTVTVQTDQAKFDTFTVSTTSVDFKYTVPVELDNPNYFPLKLAINKCDGYYRNMLIAQTTNTGTMTFPSRSKKTFVVGLTIVNSYKNSPDLIAALTTDCGPLSKHNISMNLDTTVDVVLFSSTSWGYSFKEPLSLDCSF